MSNTSIYDRLYKYKMAIVPNEDNLRQLNQEWKLQNFIFEYNRNQQRNGRENRNRKNTNRNARSQ